MASDEFDTAPWDEPENGSGGQDTGAEPDRNDERDDDDRLEIGRIDVRLPCRVFNIRHKAAVESKVSLTTEFLLRLLRTVDGLSEDEIAEFFGFSAREAGYVVTRTESLGYVERWRGQVRLTGSGVALFNAMEGHPRIYDVEPQHVRETFDLISFCPAKPDRIGPFEGGFPLLPVEDTEAVSAPTDRIRAAFRRHYGTIQLARRRPNDEPLTLYSIDDVQAEERRTALVPVSVRLTNDGRDVEPDLHQWLGVADRQDRLDVLSACASLLQDIHVSNVSADSAFDLLGECAPEQVAPHQKKDGFDAFSFIERLKMQAGSLGQDRAMRIAGTLWTSANRERVLAAVNQSSTLYRNRRQRPKAAIWWKPSIQHWGCSTDLDRLVQVLQKRYARPAPDGGNQDGGSGNERSDFETILIARNDRDVARRFGSLFDTVLTHDGGAVPSCFEMLLVPERFFVALIHAPLEDGGGYPVPLGVISYDPKQVQNAHRLMRDLIGARPLATAQADRKADWTATMMAMLDYSP